MKKVFAGLFICSTLLFSQTKLIVDAVDFKADDSKGITTLVGDVKIQMGKDKLSADQIEIYFKKAKSGKTPSKFIASGNVKFNLSTASKNYVGKGNKIIYSPIKQEYTVLGNGFLHEKADDRKIYGEKIYVNQLTGEAKISGSQKKPVRLIINIEQGEK